MSYYLFLSKKFICFKRLIYDFFLLRLVYEIKEGGRKIVYVLQNVFLYLEHST